MQTDALREGFHAKRVTTHATKREIHKATAAPNAELIELSREHILTLSLVNVLDVGVLMGQREADL
jgi:hypothetical protein